MPTTFRPSVHGWKFNNSWPSYWILTHTNVYGLDIPAPVMTSCGLCGGMCLSALDRFLAGTPIPADQNPPANGSALLKEIAQRQTDSLAAGSAWKDVIAWTARPDKGQKLSPLHSCKHLVETEEWPRLKRVIDSGRPALLCLIRVEGLANPFQNHQVLAYGYDYVAARKELTVQVYDPNRRNDDSIRLTMNFRGDFLNASDSTGNRLRGFFCIPYDRTETVGRVSAMIPHKTGVVTAFSDRAGRQGWGIYSSPDGRNVGGGARTREVYSGHAVAPVMIPYRNGVITAFDSGGAYYSPDGENLGGGGRTEVVYTGGAGGKVSALTPFKNGVLAAFADRPGRTGWGIYFSPDGKNLGGGGATREVYSGDAIALSMVPYRNGVVTVFNWGTAYYSPDGENLGGGGQTEVVYPDAAGGKVGMIMPCGTGLLTAFTDRACTTGWGVYRSPDGRNLGGGGGTALVYDGHQIVQSMSPCGNGVITAFSGGGAYYSRDGTNLGGGGTTIDVASLFGVIRLLVRFSGGHLAVLRNGDVYRVADASTPWIGANSERVYTGTWS